MAKKEIPEMLRTLTSLLIFATLLCQSAAARPEREQRPIRSMAVGSLEVGAVTLDDPLAKDSVVDPAGDTFGVGPDQVDVIDFSVDAVGGELVFIASFSAAIEPPDSAENSALQGLIDIDVDQNAGTGLMPWADFLTNADVTGMGSEYYLDLSSYRADDSAIDVVFDDGSDLGGVSTGRAAVTIFGNLFQVVVPLELIGNDNGSVSSAAIFGPVDEFTDKVPNNGSVSTVSTQPNTSILLNDDRFRVSIEWSAPGFPAGPGQVSDLRTEDTGFFYFLDAENIEFLVKVIDGCDLNNHYWVFFAGATDVEFTLTVTDTQANQTREYSNPLGQPADAVTDTTAFATCP
jgi:hypothetical protein